MRILMSMLIIAVLITAPLLNGCASSQTKEGNTSGLTAADFQLQSADGDEYTLSDLKGHPVLLNFWATWCSPCRSEMPLLQELSEDTKWLQEGLVMLAVNVQESVDEVQQFMEANGFSFTVLLDISGVVSNKYNIRGIPTTFFIDKDGIIRDVTIGAFQQKAQIEQKLSLITK